MVHHPARTATNSYLDDIARSRDGSTDTDADGPGTSACGKWAALAWCENDHGVARTLLCNREWCHDCGQKDSDSHKRRWSRLLPKAQQLTYLGYLVVTFPLQVRETLRTKEALSSMATRITKVLRSLGFERGIRRWHFMGDESTVWHPHLNYLVESGRIPASFLRTIKERIGEEVGTMCVVHYQYTSVPAKKLHLLKYVTRPTFLDWRWDAPMSYELKGFRTTWQWGLWNGPAVWQVEHEEDDSTPSVKAIRSGNCPRCATPIKWSSAVVALAVINPDGVTSHGERYFSLAADSTPATYASSLPPSRLAIISTPGQSRL